MHGAVHPRNVIAAEDGAVSILDFGRAALDGTVPPRAGVAAFYEPEMARALLSGALPPPPTPLGEQYSVAALLYLVLTGGQYADLSVEQEVLLAQVAELRPLPFTARGAEPWPTVEAVLAVALAKDPADRFPDLAAFRDAFAAAAHGGAPSRAATARRPAGADAARRLVAAWVERAMAGEDSRDLAWFALRASIARDDPELLAAADVCSVRGGSDWALEATRAAVHRARGDSAAQGAAATAFVAACDRAGDRSDLLGGRAGALAAAAGLVEGGATHVTPWARVA